MASKMESSQKQIQKNLVKRQVSQALKQCRAWCASTCNEYEFHPSECHRRVSPKESAKLTNLVKEELRIGLHFINDYHVFCLLCKKHFYSASKLDDINSFFQTHSNTVNHRLMIKLYGCNKKAMFTWKEWLVRASCAVCGEFDVEAFVIDTKLTAKDIAEMHSRSEGHASQLRARARRRLEQALPMLDVFTNMCIRKISGGERACDLCGVRIVRGPGSVVDCHVSSVKHFLNFRMFLKSEYNLGDLEFLGEERAAKILADAFRGDIVVEKASKLSAEDASGYGCGEKDCNTEDDMIRIEGLGLEKLGFSPMLVESELSVCDEDFASGKNCLLCQENVANLEKHFSSSTHQMRKAIFKQGNFLSRKASAEYVAKREKRLRMLKEQIEKYTKCKNRLEKKNLYFGMPFVPECESSDVIFGEPKAKKSKAKAEKRSDAKVFDELCEKFDVKWGLKRLDLRVHKSSDVLNSVVHDVIPLQVVQSLLDKDFSAADNRFRCKRCNRYVHGEMRFGHVLEEYGITKGRAAAAAAAKFLQKKFAATIKRWIVASASMLVCVACYVVIEKIKFIFVHLTSEGHAKKCESLESPLVSLTDYSVHPRKRVVKCKKCDSAVPLNGCFDAGAKPTVNHFALLMKVVKNHHPNCSNKPAASAETKASPAKDKNKVKKKKMGFEGNDARRFIAKDRLDMFLDGLWDEWYGDWLDRRSLPAVFEEYDAIDAAELAEDAAAKRRAARTEDRAINFLQEIFERGGDFDMFLCTTCLVNEPLKSVFHHVCGEDHAKNQSIVKELRFWTCDVCKMVLLGAEPGRHLHENSVYHINAERKVTGKVPPRPRNHHQIVQLLIVEGEFKGLPNPEAFASRAFRKYGTVTKVYSKSNKMYVAFKEANVVDDIIKANRDPGLSRGTFYESWPQHVMMSGMIYCLGHYDRLVNFISELESNATVQTASLEELSEQVCKSVTNALSDKYPKVRCYRFGSRVTGLALTSSDIDIFVDLEDFYFTREDNMNYQRNAVLTVARALRKTKEFSGVTEIISSRVPIVKCSHKETKIACDLSFKNGLSCENTKLIMFMLSLDDRVSKVILFLKQWLQVNHLHGPPMFCSYALTMLVFYYLQQKPNPVLPTVRHLQECYTGPESIILHWRIGFSTNREDVAATKNVDSVPQLILGFFKFCSEFDFRKNVVCPLTGEPLERVAFAKDDALPEPYARFAQYIRPSNYLTDSVAIMDPLDLDKNLTYHFPAYKFEVFLYFCRISARLLSKSINSEQFDHLY